MRNVRLQLTLSGPIIVICALAIGMTVFLDVGKLERTLGDVEQSRLRYTLGDLRATLETGLDLGLPVAQLGNAQAAIDFEVRNDRDITAISVYDRAGLRVFHAGAGVAALERHTGRDWLSRGGDAILAGTTLYNNFDVEAGTIVLRYDGHAHTAFMDGMARRLRLAACVIAALCALLLLLGVGRIARRIEACHGPLDAGLGSDDDAALAARVLACAAQARTDLALADAALTRSEERHEP